MLIDPTQPTLTRPSPLRHDHLRVGCGPRSKQGSGLAGLSWRMVLILFQTLHHHGSIRDLCHLPAGLDFAHLSPSLESLEYDCARERKSDRAKR